MEKYKQNLRIEGNKVISYTTHVATIKGTELHQLGYWSTTTQRHINYVAKELNLTLVKHTENMDLITITAVDLGGGSSDTMNRTFDTKNLSKLKDLVLNWEAEEVPFVRYELVVDELIISEDLREALDSLQVTI